MGSEASPDPGMTHVMGNAAVFQASAPMLAPNKITCFAP